MQARNGRGFTLVEVGVCLVVAVVLGFLIVPVLFTPTRCCGGRQLKDSTQVRGVHQGLAMWAQTNQDRYPLPSLLDVKNETVEATGRAKDTTANIISILIFNGFFGPELCVSPAEANGAVKVMPNYTYEAPPGAVSPKGALWDPSFAADFSGGKTGNLSYAHMLPVGPRLEKWSSTFSDTEAVVGNRGPQILGLSYGKQHSLPELANTASNTLLIHGSRGDWEGNVAYNDNHVNFETRMDPEGLVYPAKAKGRLNARLTGDYLFFDEPDDESGVNAFLSIYTSAGDTAADFTQLWD